MFSFIFHLFKLTAYQLYSALQEYGAIEHLTCHFEEDIADVMFVHTQEALRSTKEIQVNFSQLYLEWSPYPYA